MVLLFIVAAPPTTVVVAPLRLLPTSLFWLCPFAHFPPFLVVDPVATHVVVVTMAMAPHH